MAAPSEEDKAQSPEALSSAPTEIDLFVGQAEQGFIVDNLAALLDAGASMRVILDKLPLETTLDYIATLMSLGASQEQILAKMSVFEVTIFHEHITAAGLVLDPEWMLKSLQDWYSERGFVPSILVKQLDFFLDLGISPDDVLALIKQDNDYPAYLIQVAKLLIDEGVNISPEEIDRAVDAVQSSSRGTDKILENLKDLVALGANVDPRYIIDEYLKNTDGRGSSALMINIEQVLAVYPDVDINAIIENTDRSSFIKNRLGYLLNHGADPRVTVEKLSGEDIAENMTLLIRALQRSGYSVDLLIERYGYLNRVLYYLEDLVEAGASREAILSKTTGFGVLREMQRLLDVGFTIDELVAKLSAHEKIENFSILTSHGATVDLDEAVDNILDIDEYDANSSPEVLKKVAEFLLTHLKTLQNGGADILKIASQKELQALLDSMMSDEHRSLFTLAKLKDKKA